MAFYIGVFYNAEDSSVYFEENGLVMVKPFEERMKLSREKHIQHSRGRAQNLCIKDYMIRIQFKCKVESQLGWSFLTEEFYILYCRVYTFKNTDKLSENSSITHRYSREITVNA